MRLHCPVRAVLLCVGIVVLVASPVFAQMTLYVDDDAPTDPGPGDPLVSDPLEDGSPGHPFDAIQEGINASATGDIVLILPGTYTGIGNRDLDLTGKAVTIEGRDGAASTVIDAEQQGRGFYFHSGETQDTVIRGLTIQNGSDDGIYCYGTRQATDPRIIDCVITDCARDGAYVFTLAVGCNSEWARPRFERCTFVGNGRSGVYVRGKGVDACSGSTSGYSKVTLANCVVTCNSTDGVVLEANDGDWATHGTARAEITNGIIAANGAHGVSIFGDSFCTLILTNVAIVSNTQAGVNASSPPEQKTVNVTNSIVAMNDRGIAIEPGVAFNLQYNDVWGNTTGDYIGLTDPTGSDGNIDTDPRFVRNPDPGEGGWDGLDDDHGDLHLTAGSPCIDAGDSAAVPTDVADLDGDGDTSERTPLDLGGDPRFTDDPNTVDTGVADPPDYPAVVDMGPYEDQPDCNGNSIPDDQDIANCDPNDPACADCNNNGIPDECDIADCDPNDSACQDCNDNGIPRRVRHSR